MTFDKIRQQIGDHLRGPYGEQLWDLMCGLRGPDTPSERPDMSQTDRDRAYRGRRERKYKTVEVIRAAAFFGAGGGSARKHSDTQVLLPPVGEWDHFDKHVERAAKVLGLEVVTGKRNIVGIEATIKTKLTNDPKFTTILPFENALTDHDDDDEPEEEPEYDGPDK